MWLRSDVIVGGGEWSRIWVGLRVRGGKGEGRERSWRRKEVPSSENVGCKGKQRKRRESARRNG